MALDFIGTGLAAFCRGFPTEMNGIVALHGGFEHSALAGGFQGCAGSAARPADDAQLGFIMYDNLRIAQIIVQIGGDVFGAGFLLGGHQHTLGLQGVPLLFQSAMFVEFALELFEINRRGGEHIGAGFQAS